MGEFMQLCNCCDVAAFVVAVGSVMGEFMPLRYGPPWTLLYLLPVGECGGVLRLAAQDQGANHLILGDSVPVTHYHLQLHITQAAVLGR